MFVLDLPNEAHEIVSFRSDVEMVEAIRHLSQRLQTNRSAVIRVALANLIADAKGKNVYSIRELMR
jgi:predicted transcriptional regulator